MATATVFAMQSVDIPPDYVAAGTAEYGDNGPDNGSDPEFTALSQTDASAGRTTWNSNYQPDGSWDTGAVPVRLTFAPDGHGNDVVTWTVNGETPVSVTVPAVTLRAVEVVAGTQTNASVQWSDLNVTFAQGSTSDSYDATSSTDPAVDTTTASDTTAESGVVVTPDASDDTSVTVTGDIRFTLPPGSYPNPGDLFADVVIYGN